MLAPLALDQGGPAPWALTQEIRAFTVRTEGRLDVLEKAVGA